MNEDEVERSNLVEVECEFIRETERAILVDDGDRQVWLPKSKIEWNFERKPSHKELVGKVLLPDWLAKEKELI